jgi:Flp pilus assembly protein TadG
VRTAWRSRERERGSATLEIAVLGPALLLLIFTVVQVGLVYFARSLALGAAQEGVTAARTYEAAPDAGVQRALAFVSRSAGDSLRDVEVTAERTATDTVQVRVSGRALSVLPGFPGLRVSQSAEAPIERFTTAGAP